MPGEFWILDRVGVFGDTAEHAHIQRSGLPLTPRLLGMRNPHTIHELPVRHSPDYVILTELLGSQCTVVLRAQYIDR